MIIVKCNEDNFAYDIHSLIKAFYPSEEVKVFVKGEKELHSDEGLPELEIVFLADSIEISSLNDSIRVIADYNNRSEYKNELKLALYSYLSKLTNKLLPWGTLTGIRPTKIAKGLIDDGASNDDVVSYMKSRYLCSDEKASLSIDIAHYENKILEPIDYEKGYSLYIGIPFCPSTCLYCSFTSFPIAKYRHLARRGSDRPGSERQSRCRDGHQIHHSRWLHQKPLCQVCPQIPHRSVFERQTFQPAFLARVPSRKQGA